MDYAAAARPAAMQDAAPNFGIVVMVALALASAAIGVGYPEATSAEYQPAAIALTGP